MAKSLLRNFHRYCSFLSRTWTALTLAYLHCCHRLRHIRHSSTEGRTRLWLHDGALQRFWPKWPKTLIGFQGLPGCGFAMAKHVFLLFHSVFWRLAGVVEVSSRETRHFSEALACVAALVSAITAIVVSSPAMAPLATRSYSRGAGGGVSL